MIKYCDSVARTSKLYCSDCYSKIRKGEHVVFELCNDRMRNVYCCKCGDKYAQNVIDDSEHIFSSEALGQG